MLFVCSVSWLFLLGCQYQCKWLTGKTRLRSDLKCVDWDVKPYSLTCSLTHSLWHIHTLTHSSCSQSLSAMHGWYWHYRANKGLDNPPPRWIQEPLVVRRTLAVLCFCVCSGSALLGDLLGVSRSREHDLLSVLLIYPWIFLCLLIMCHFSVGILFMLMYVSCFGLFVSTCQLIV